MGICWLQQASQVWNSPLLIFLLTIYNVALGQQYENILTIHFLFSFSFSFYFFFIRQLGSRWRKPLSALHNQSHYGYTNRRILSCNFHFPRVLSTENHWNTISYICNCRSSFSSPSHTNNRVVVKCIIPRQNRRVYPVWYQKKKKKIAIRKKYLVVSHCLIYVSRKCA